MLAPVGRVPLEVINKLLLDTPITASPWGSEMSYTLGWSLVLIVVKSTVILMAAAVIARMLRRSSAAVRHFIWLVALIGVLATPVVTLIGPSWGPNVSRFAWPASAAPEEPLNAAKVVLSLPQPLKRSDVGVASQELAEDSAGSTSRWALFGGGVWIVGVAVALVPLVLGVLGVEWFRRSSQSVKSSDWTQLLQNSSRCLGIRRRVELRRTPFALNPLASGVFRPFVLLPHQCESWSGDRRRIILLHELAHIKRWDILALWVARVACAVHWFHPLVWYAARQLRMEREAACDDLVLLTGTKATDYSEQLVAFARQQRAPGWLSASALAMSDGRQLEKRVSWILDSRRKRLPLSRPMFAALAVAGLLLGTAVATAGKVTVKDRNGKTIAEIDVPAGGSVTVTEEKKAGHRLSEQESRDLWRYLLESHKSALDSRNTKKAKNNKKEVCMQCHTAHAWSADVDPRWTDTHKCSACHSNVEDQEGSTCPALGRSLKDLIHHRWIVPSHDGGKKPSTKSKKDDAAKKESDADKANTTLTDDETVKIGRRLYLDLTGLPPTEEQLNALANDPRPDRLDRVANQLLNPGQLVLEGGVPVEAGQRANLTRQLYLLLMKSKNGIAEDEAGRIAQMVVDLVDQLDADSDPTTFQFDPHPEDGWDETNLKSVTGRER